MLVPLKVLDGYILKKTYQKETCVGFLTITLKGAFHKKSPLTTKINVLRNSRRKRIEH